MAENLTVSPAIIVYALVIASAGIYGIASLFALKHQEKHENDDD